MILKGLNGALGGTRTPDTLVRSQVLYPAELRAQWGVDDHFLFLVYMTQEGDQNGGPYRIRTYDTEVKSLLLYHLS